MSNVVNLAEWKRARGAKRLRSETLSSIEKVERDIEQVKRLLAEIHQGKT